MNKEWNDNYNSFNSNKALMYRQWYDGIVKGEFLPPVEASVDPVNDCNLNCLWCNGYDVRKRKEMMSPYHLLELCDFFAKWGVKAVCFAGGGEPTMHPALGDAFQRLHVLKVPSAIITNGLFLDEEQIKRIATYAQWIGISIDCAKEETYEKIKGRNMFKTVMRNISTLLSYNPREVTYKFLVNKFNQYEIYDAIRTAALIGCHCIHIRPVSYKNFQKHEEPHDIIRINKQIDEGFQDYGDKIKIFAIRHKYNEKMHVKFPFKKCMVTPLMPIFSADGWVTACIDRKADNSLRLCKHDNPESVMKFWGSKEHREILNRINLKECPKCTLNIAQEIYEKAIIEDSMSWRFV